MLVALVAAATRDARADGLLFIGNSYTYQNAEDGLAPCAVHIIEELSGAAPGYTLVAKGGWTLAGHLADAGTDGEQLHDMLGLGDLTWDTVILQEQSQIPGFWAVPGSPFQQSLDAAVGLDTLAEDAQAQTVFLMTWGRREGDPVNFLLYPDFPSMQDLLAQGYEQYAAAASLTLPAAKIAPAGLAWQLAWDDAVADGQDPLDSNGLFWRLYAADGSHPSVLGSYLAGLVLATTLTGKDPTTTTWRPAGVTTEDAAALRDLARRVVLGEAPPPGTWPVPETIEVLHEGQITEMELEGYLKGVLPEEIGTDFPFEAARAQAIASRTYALRYTALHGPICTTSQCQVWAPEHFPFTDLAVDSTAGVVALHDLAPAQTVYFASCGGHTLSSEDIWGDPQPYLVGVECIENKAGLCTGTCNPEVPDESLCWDPFGHRVGLCQRGAEAMGSCGSSFQEILAHYYTGIELANLPPEPPVEPGPETTETSPETAPDGYGEILSEDAVAWETIGRDTPGPDLVPPGSEDTPVSRDPGNKSHPPDTTIAGDAPAGSSGGCAAGTGPRPLSALLLVTLAAALLRRRHRIQTDR